DRALPQGARRQGRQEDPHRLGPALRPRGQEPGLRQGAGDPPCRWVLEDRARAYRGWAASEDDEPGIGSYDRFKQLFDKYAKEAGKELYLIPYFIAAHPGTTDEDMMHLALWLKKHRYRADQVQTFLPSPMSVSAAMYHSGRNTLRPVRRAAGEAVFSAKGFKPRRLHKASLRYHDPENWPVLREALKRMGRADLIGPGKHHLVPPWQPAGTGLSGVEGARAGRKHRAQRFLTQHTTQS